MENFDISVNTTVDGSPFKITSADAMEIVNKTPPLAKPLPVDPIGKCVLRPYPHTFPVLFFYRLLSVHAFTFIRPIEYCRSKCCKL